MNCRSFFIAVVFASCTAVAESEQQFASIGDFKLTSGQVIEDCRIGYRILGELNADKSNVVVVPTWFTGTTGGLVNGGVIGPGKLADTDKYFVITFDALGNGVSTSPSNSNAQSDDKFPRITTEDMVKTQHEVLTEHLGLDHVKAVLGISMGGMQTFQWITTYPDFMDKAVPIDGSPKMTSFDIIQWQLHKDVIEVMQQDGHSNSEIMAIVSPLNLLSLFTPDYIVENVAPEKLDAFLADSLNGYSDIDGYDYVSQLEAMLAVNLLGSSDESRRRFAATVKAEVLIVGAPSDHMVNATPGRQIAPLIDAEYFEVESNCGHISSSCEVENVRARVHDFLSQE